MDAAAKQYLQVASSSARHHYTANEPWSIRFLGIKLTSPLDDTIYDIVHATQARAYWQNRRDLPDVVFEDINWTAYQGARLSSPLHTNTFITKHSVGMCGVGKFMVQWRQREKPSCPRCGAFEDAPHVWKCHGENADIIWQASKDSLESWLDKKGTDPDLSSFLLSLLDTWRNDVSPPDPPFSLRHLLERQLGIGCQYLLEGWLSWE
jgi:hypothetical protein